ncbi:MAG: DUF2150 family protein [Methanotrichaceae archaeon]|nr:DUF2150 family protein [Methanotrichaceae archaeon]
MNEEFYTKKRWLNWINKVKESNFKLPDIEEGDVGAVFVYIMDDVVLACLKVLARYNRGIIAADEATSTIDDIRDIVFEDHDSLGEDADMMLDSLKTSLAAVFHSCQRSIDGDFDKETPIGDLLREALDAEAEEEFDRALDIVSVVGARVIGGEAMLDLSDIPYCMVAELLDGVDAISAAMIGDDSYKEDDGDDGDEEA